jgi:hypothetical protein
MSSLHDATVALAPDLVQLSHRVTSKEDKQPMVPLTPSTTAAGFKTSATLALGCSGEKLLWRVYKPFAPPQVFITNIVSLASKARFDFFMEHVLLVGDPHCY